ncbi:MAG: HNH endonuclease signature motif containing protein [Armatimonadota bacterium]|nr:HNH endonuclease signature motif containing protein [Armatimonadota bacterium]
MLVPRGHSRCPRHARPPFAGASRRLSGRAGGYTRAWERERSRFLRENPTCAACGAEATVVDHVHPHRGDPVLFWAESNWQPLCAPCHARKTAHEAREVRERRAMRG